MHMNQALIKTTDNGIMKFTKLTAVSSVTVAGHLKVRHSNLMRSVKKAENYHKSHNSDQSSESIAFNPIFEDWEYQIRGKNYPCKIMNEDGVKALIKVIDTQEAYDYFVILMGEFNIMREERNSREHSKQVSRPMTDQIKRLQEKLYDEGSGAAPHIYPNTAKQIHRAATRRPMPKGGIEYGLLSSDENYKVAEFREDVNALIEDALDDGVKARDVKNEIRKMLREVAA